MSFEPHSYKGIAREGRIDLEIGADIPDGVEVTVVVKRPLKGSTAADLLNSEIFGMWADRTDIDDSAEFARNLRDRAWSRAS